MKPIQFLFNTSSNASRVMLCERKEVDVVLEKNGKKQIIISVEDFKKVNRRQLILLLRRVVALAKAHRLKKITLDLNDFAFASLALPPHELAEIASAAFEMANFEFIRYKTPPPEGWSFVDVIFVEGAKSRDAKDGFMRGRIIAQEVNAMRELANTPGGEMTPDVLARAAKSAARGTKIRVRALGVPEMKKLGMGGIVGVGQGSDAKPRFIVMEYFAGPQGGKPTVLVGKGITFDTGGLNIKPGTAMEEMHMDMSGGAAVIHALRALARLRVKRNIVALVPAAENMPSGRSYRMHDVLRTMGGKTVEVGHTDAEGRVVLADALEYAKRYKPALVIDVATLTGSAMAVLGQRASAVFATSEDLEKQVRMAGERSGDYVWPFPLWEEYEEMIKGTFADVTNSSKQRYGGTVEGAMFLWQFIKGYPWIHIDMAPRISAIEGEFLAKGSAGAPVRLLVEFLSQ